MTFALVTGASSGIGTEFARQLAARKVGLVLTARRTDRLEAIRQELVAKHGVIVHVVPQDLAQKGAAAALHEACARLGVEIELLINNAGYGLQGRHVELDPGAIERMTQVNVHALTELTLLFGRDMAKRGRGRILNVASAAAFQPSPFVAAYAATKAYVLSFSEAVRFELAQSGVSVTTLYPGITTTEFNDVAGARTPKAMDLSILGPAEVARVGLSAMFGGRRAVVPGLINRLNAFFAGILPRGLITWFTGRLMQAANAETK